jgi:GLPGLI family protein
MKNIFLSIFLISFAFTSAQTHRFLYEMSYKSDSLSEKVNKLNMVLDITGNDVQYYDFNAIKTDSINRIQNGYSTYTSSFAKLKRSISSEKNENYFLIGDDYFYFKSTDKISWKISPEMKEKNQMKLQKPLVKKVTKFKQKLCDLCVIHCNLCS